jgi:hypothetical protein
MGPTYRQCSDEKSKPNFVSTHLNCARRSARANGIEQTADGEAKSPLSCLPCSVFLNDSVDTVHRSYLPRTLEAARESRRKRLPTLSLKSTKARINLCASSLVLFSSWPIHIKNSPATGWLGFKRLHSNSNLSSESIRKAQIALTSDLDLRQTSRRMWRHRK